MTGREASPTHYMGCECQECMPGIGAGREPTVYRCCDHWCGCLGDERDQHPTPCEQGCPPLTPSARKATPDA